MLAVRRTMALLLAISGIKSVGSFSLSSPRVRHPFVVPRATSTRKIARGERVVLRSGDGSASAIQSHKEAIARLENELLLQKAALARAQEALASVATSKKAAASKMVETPMRSLVKALGWRLTAGLVTFSTSFYFTGGDWAVAGAIVGSDFLSKSGTMYVGERLFNKVQIGRSSSGRDNPLRSVAKALIWRLFAFVQTLVVSSIIIAKTGGGSVNAAGAAAKIAGMDSIVKTCLMVVYDQIWSRINWGRELENVGGDGI